MAQQALVVLGAGVHAKSHIEKLLAQGIKTIYYFDPATELELQAGVDVKRYNTIDELFAATPGIPVYVASPDKFHLNQIHRALLEDRDVFCEKPLLNNKDEIDGLIELFAAARQRGKIITSCHPRRFDPPFAVTLKNMIEQRSGYTQALGAVKEVAIHFDYKAPKPSLPIPSMMMDKSNHDLDMLRFLFKIQSIEIEKKYDSPRAFGIEGELKTTEGENIKFSFGGGRYAEEGYQEWIELDFEHGYVLINPNKAMKQTADPKNGSADYDAEIIVINDQKRTVQYYHEAQKGTDYARRIYGVNKAVLGQLDGGKAYLSEADLLFNNVLPARLETPWNASDDQMQGVNANFQTLQDKHKLSAHLSDIIKAAEAKSYDEAKGAMTTYKKAKASYDVDAAGILSELDLRNETKTQFNEKENEEDLASRTQKLKESALIAEQYLKAYERSTGVIPFYRANGELFFGMVESQIKHNGQVYGIYDLAAGGEDMRIKHLSTGTQLSLDIRKLNRTPVPFKYNTLMVPVSNPNNHQPLTSFAEFDFAGANRYFYDNVKQPELSLLRRRNLFIQLIDQMMKHGWQIEAVETDLVAAANEVREEHGFILNPTETRQENCQSIELQLPSLRYDNLVHPIQHILYCVETTEAIAQDTKLASSHTSYKDEEGSWVSLKELDAHYTAWLERIDTMMGDSPQERMNRLVFMANLQKYVGIVLLFAGERELREAWIKKLPELKDELVSDYYLSYDYSDFITRLIKLDPQTISASEWASLSELGERPNQATEESISACLSAAKPVLTVRGIGMFANTARQEPESSVSLSKPGF